MSQPHSPHRSDSSEHTRRRLALVGSLAVAIGALAWLAFGGIGDNLVYYWSPTQLLEAGEEAQGAKIRLGGMVREGSVVFDDDTLELSFVVHDGDNEVTVHSRGTPPAMFREGIGAVVEGRMGDDGTFEGQRLLIKHSNEYRAPVDGEHPHDVYETVEGL